MPDCSAFNIPTLLLNSAFPKSSKNKLQFKTLRRRGCGRGHTDTAPVTKTRGGHTDTGCGHTDTKTGSQIWSQIWSQRWGAWSQRRVKGHKDGVGHKDEVITIITSDIKDEGEIR